MRRFLIAYLAAAAAFFVLDLLWIGVVALDWYRAAIGHLMLPEPRVGYAALFYAVYVAGIVRFAIAPALGEGAWTGAARAGAAFGFFCYLTYDMTNLATLQGWPVWISLVDLAWGTFATGCAATAGFLAARPRAQADA